MSNTFASRAADTLLPPALSSSEGYAATKAVNGVNVQIVPGNNVTQISVTNSAAETALPLGAGQCGYLSIQNLSTSANPAFVAFKLGTSVAAVTTTNGWEIPTGTTVHFFLDKDVCDFIECISAGTATLKMYVSSVVE